MGNWASKIIIDYIDRCLYSAGVIPADELWEINAAIVQLLNGKGRKPLTNLERDIKGKRSFIKIVNNDNTCLARAIMVGFRRCLALENKENKVLTQQYNRIRDSRGKLQGIEAQNLIKAVNLHLDRAGLIQNVYKYERYLKISIVVLSVMNRKPESLQWFSKLWQKNIPVSYRKRWLKDILMWSLEWMEWCVNNIIVHNVKKSFKSRTQHKCKSWCNICGREKCNMEQEVICTACNRKYRSQDCLKAHKQQEERQVEAKIKVKYYLHFANKFGNAMNVELQFKDMRETLHCMNVVKDNSKICQKFHLEEDQHLCYMRAISFRSYTRKINILWFWVHIKKQCAKFCCGT